MSGYAIGVSWRRLLAELPTDEVLRQAGLPTDLLIQPDPRVDASGYFRLCRSVASASDALLPLRVVESISADNFDPPVVAALCSPDLATAVQRMSRYQTLDAPVTIEIDDGASLQIRMKWAETEVPDVWLTTMAMFFTRVARLGLRKTVGPIEVRMPARPEPEEAFLSYFGCPIETGPLVEVTFRSEDAHRPFATANPDTWRLLEPHYRQRRAALTGTPPLSVQVRQMLVEALSGGAQGEVSRESVGLPEMLEIARRLSVSPRTLQRRLRTEGTSFSQLVRHTREELACYYLSATRRKMSEIANMLGFGRPSSFFRAFQEWRGQTPNEFRRRVSRN